MIVLFDNRGYKLTFNKIHGTYHVTTPDDKGYYYDNPLEAWNAYVTLLDTAVRRSIGDMLEHSGRNRYTGGENDG